jgi:hypothetical protein
MQASCHCNPTPGQWNSHSTPSYKWGSCNSMNRSHGQKVRKLVRNSMGTETPVSLCPKPSIKLLNSSSAIVSFPYVSETMMLQLYHCERSCPGVIWPWGGCSLRMALLWKMGSLPHQEQQDHTRIDTKTTGDNFSPQVTGIHQNLRWGHTGEPCWVRLLIMPSVWDLKAEAAL